MVRAQPDRIEREITLSAAPERVWQALTSAPELASWFGDSAEIDLRPGGAARFGWSGHGDAFAVVEVVDPPRRFAFRWASELGVPVEEGPSTLVEFTLEPDDGGGTRLRLVESGFAALPESVREQHFSENESGWRSELADLDEHLASR